MSSAFARHLRYAYYSLRYPSARDFISGGLGIEARYERCRSYWRKHLLYTKEFQEGAFRSFRPESVSVLGAGRLLDLNTEIVAKLPGPVHFLDLDPTCIGAWKRLRALRGKGRVTEFHVQDVTGVIELWSEAVSRRRPRTGTELIRALHDLPAAKADESSLPRTDLTISLNLLSQIPLYWEDRAEKWWYRLSAAKPSPEFRQIVLKQMGDLQSAHLQTLGGLSSKAVLIFTDVFFHYYRPELSEWRTESAIHSTEQLKLAGHTCVARDSWFWHVAPFGIEDFESGAIHEVQALLFRRDSD